MEVIHQDRRDDRRYSIELELRYKVIARTRIQLSGIGRTLNMSSGGILFSVDQGLPVGAFVELSILWPVLLQNTCALTLLVVGRVVRFENSTVAVKISRYEFMTRSGRTQDLNSTKPPTSYIA
jgi:hypothetical protein